ncbi:TonB-dependent receptor plug domain-containing protein [Luteolibacter luteus]|uniref:TonB-dependent receptor n=1 Tax=Luteolibacter luteus TaxID=2728835 RepID=A0A858RRK3_9BACT|nr:TonB-dependent receptor [Luteolibacter luteus]QJE98969.1 TonB-dependent receptor [Luteolibacter luteus]
MRSAWTWKLGITSSVGMMLGATSRVRAEESEQPLPPLVVEAMRPGTIEVERMASPVPMAGLSQEELEERPALQLGDALKYAPGVYLNGNINENDDLQLRGMPKGYSRTQISGVSIPEGSGEAREFQLNRLPTGLFKEAKIIRNPTAEYESDGIAGRLELETIDIPTSFSGDVHLGYGARNRETPLWDGSVLLGGRPVEWFGTLAAFSYGLDPTLKVKNTFDYAANGQLKKGSVRHEDTPVETYSAFLDAGFFYEGGEFHIKPLYLRREIEKRSQKSGIDYTKAASKDESFDDDAEDRREQTEGATATSVHRWSEDARQESVMAYYKSFERMPRSLTDSYKESGGVMTYDGSSLEDYYKEDETFDFQTKTILDLATPLKQQVRFGIAARAKNRESDSHLREFDDAGVVTDLTTPADRYRLSEDYIAGFVQDQIWLTEDLSLLPGLRAEHMKLDSRDGGTRQSSRSTMDWNPALHALYQPSKEVSVHLGLSRTVNRPQFDQLSPYRRINDDDERVEIGNPDLDPAKSWNVDLGVDWKKGPFFIAANVFYKEISDVIQEDRAGTVLVGGDTYDLYQSRNVGDGWLKGVELDERFDLGDAGITWLEGLSLWSNQSIYSSRVHYASGATSPFEEQPEFISNVGVDYEFKKTGTRFSIYGNFVDDFEWSETDGTRIGYLSEWIVNLSAHQRLGAGLEAFVEVINLFDEQRFETETKTNGDFRHEDITGGRAILAGLNYHF